MNVTLDRRQQDFASTRLSLCSCFGLLLFHEGSKVRDGLFHHASAFDHLRQEHFALTEQVTDDAHAIHQWAFDNLQAAIVLLPCFFGVLFNVLVDSADQRVFQAFLNVGLSPT